MPLQDWFDGGDSPLARLGSFRFDDPAGEVGIETQLVGAGHRVYQVPLTYRGAPLAGAEAFLMGTMEHSVLGHRWVYDATGDPVYVAELAVAQLTSTGTDGAAVPELVIGTPHTAAGITAIPVGPLALVLRRVVGATGTPQPGPHLTVSWSGVEQQLLASVGDGPAAP
ncbi:maltokinase N-terminal cap-like domain-containing protein [Arthrobacter sp. TMN-49]